MNPLPNRPLLNNAPIPTIPNVPSFEQMPYRPRKVLPEGGALPNGMGLMSGPSSAPAASGNQMQNLEPRNPMSSAVLPQLQQPPPGHQQQPQPQDNGPQPPSLLADRDKDEDNEHRQITAIFRPDDAGDWKEKLRLAHEAAEQERLAKEAQARASAWGRQDEDELKEEEESDDDEGSTVIGEGEGNKMWKAKRTLRKYVISFLPTSFPH
jgi:striatin 1/3/4